MPQKLSPHSSGIAGFQQTSAFIENVLFSKAQTEQAEAPVGLVKGHSDIVNATR